MTRASSSERLPDRLGASAPGRAILFLAGGWIAIGIYFLLPSTPQAILYAAIGLAGVAAIVIGSQKLEAERLAWRLFGLGFMCEVAGDTFSSYYEIHLNREPPLPSAADVFYLGGYPLLVLGIYLLLRKRGGTTTLVGVLDTVIVFAAVATVQWMFFVEPYRHVPLATDARIVSAAYPVLDVLLLVGLAQLMLGVGRRTFAQWVLLASVVLWVGGDEVFALSAGHYAQGGWVDTFWLGSYVVWGGAALAIPADGSSVGRERRSVPRLTRGRLVLLAAALLAAPVSLVVERELRHRFHPVAAAIGSAVIAVLVLVRLAGLVRLVDQARLEERKARRDADLARERIEEQNTKLLEFDRLKDELLSSVSHELRTPLTSISGYVELLLEEEDNPEERRHLEIVQRNTTRLLSLVSDLLFAARLQSGHLELQLGPVDLRVLVEQAADAARPHADAARVVLHVRAEEVPPIEGERDRLAQLLDNLVSNAIKFTPAGGKVEVALASRNGEAWIEVSDTGIGLSEDELAQLFTRFYRTNTAAEAQIPGTGLGLFIAKAIVEAHGGRISVRSSVGEGTTFVVELPVAR
jgi:signal transduction histidine kinase